jgi:antitoxin (DNA-binding transcriptional repressor) of toxin-antitoxin stability system
MEASIIDLRYKMKEVLKALDRNENVTITYHGKIKGVIHPVRSNEDLKVSDHPFFGSHPATKQTVEEIMENLRSGRINAI